MNNKDKCQITMFFDFWKKYFIRDSSNTEDMTIALENNNNINSLYAIVENGLKENVSEFIFINEMHQE